MATEELDERIRSAKESLAALVAERNQIRAIAREAAIASSPWGVGDRVTTKLAYRNYTVRRVNPRSLIVDMGGSFNQERIPVDRVLPADPKKETPIKHLPTRFPARDWGAWW